MKKLLAALAILITVNAYSQNTTTLPMGTNPSTISIRTKGTDSLHTSWFSFPGIGWNQFLSATEISLRYAPNLRKQFNVKTYGAKGDGVADDGAAIQLAITAAIANGGGIVYFPKGIYRLHGALVNSGGTGIGSPNSQLYIPYTNYTNGFNSVSLVGESPPALLASVLGASPTNRGGVIIYSDITGSGTTPSILGTIGAAATGNFNYVSVAITNIEFRVKANIAASGPTMSAVNMYNVGGNVNIEHSAVGLDTATFYSVSPVAETAGFILPRVGGGQSVINDIGVTGLKYGFVISEHVTGDLITAVGCERAIVGLYADHPNFLGRVNSAWCKYPVTSHSGTTFANGGGGINTTRIAQLDNEFQTGYGSWFDQAYTVYDPGNELRGGMEYQMVRRNVGVDTVSFTANGATKFTPIRIGNRDIRNLAVNGTAVNSTLWNGYSNSFSSPISTGVTGVLVGDGTTSIKMGNRAGVKTFLGIDSAIYNNSVSNILSISANYTISMSNWGIGYNSTLVVFVNASAGAVSITVPVPPIGTGRTIYIKKIDATANAVTVVNGGIPDGATLTTQYQSRQLINSGDNWWNF